jgi:hypothetical protein
VLWATAMTTVMHATNTNYRNIFDHFGPSHLEVGEFNFRYGWHIRSSFRQLKIGRMGIRPRLLWFLFRF